MTTCTNPEAHDAHMQMNGECPWCGAADAGATRAPAAWDFADADTIDTSTDLGAEVIRQLTDRSLAERVREMVAHPALFTEAERRAAIAEARRRWPE